MLVFKPTTKEKKCDKSAYQELKTEELITAPLPPISQACSEEKKSFFRIEKDITYIHTHEIIV